MGLSTPDRPEPSFERNLGVRDHAWRWHLLLVIVESKHFFWWSRWWFQRFIFTPTWGSDPNWLISFAFCAARSFHVQCQPVPCVAVLSFISSATDEAGKSWNIWRYVSWNPGRSIGAQAGFSLTVFFKREQRVSYCFCRWIYAALEVRFMEAVSWPFGSCFPSADRTSEVLLAL